MMQRPATAVLLTLSACDALGVGSAVGPGVLDARANATVLLSSSRGSRYRHHQKRHSQALSAPDSKRKPTQLEAPICIPDASHRGRAAPRVFLLGQQKAGTTTIARHLMSMGVQRASSTAESVGWKESHTFDQDDLCGFFGHCKMEKVGACLTGACPAPNSTFRVAKVRANWLATLDKSPCNAGAPETSILAEMTPFNARLPGLPALLAGALYPRPSHAHMRFVFMVREPLARMHSAYRTVFAPVILNDQRAVDAAPWDVNAGFSSYVEMLQRAAAAPLNSATLKAAPTTFQRLMLRPDIARNRTFDPLFRSVYSRNIEPWLEAFGPSSGARFVIIPMMWAMAHQKEAMGVIARQLDLPLKLGAFQGSIHENDGTDSGHKDLGNVATGSAILEDDLQQTGILWAREFFDAANAEFARIVALGLEPRFGAWMHLAGYDGGADDANAVQRYLDANW